MKFHSKLFIALGAFAFSVIAHEEKFENVQVAFRPQYAYFYNDNGDTIPDGKNVKFHFKGPKSPNITLSNDGIIRGMDEGIYTIEISVSIEEGALALKKNGGLESISLASQPSNITPPVTRLAIPLITINKNDTLTLANTYQADMTVRTAEIKLFKIANF